MIIYSIYKCVNTINGKIYIGFTNNFLKRIDEHRRDHKTLKNKFYNAIRKHGWNNFQFELLYQSLDGEHTLKTMEPYFITENNSFKKGYNSTKGGEGILGYKHSEITKQKMSKPKSESHKHKLKLARKNREIEPAKGHKWTPERREKIILSRTNKPNIKNRKKLKTPDGIFDSVTEAATHFGHNVYYMSRKIKKNPDLFEFV